MQLLYPYGWGIIYTMRPTLLFVSLFLVVSIASGCSPKDKSPTPAVPSPGQVEVTPEAITPTITTEPLAAMINGEGITLADYQAELARFKSALPDQESPEKVVLDEMISLKLLEQGSVEKNFTVTDEAVQQKLDDLSNQMGGTEQLNSWMASTGYTLDQIKISLRQAISVAWMRDQITSSVPTAADQVHVRQILLLAEGNAQSVLQQIRSGADFATLAVQYDPITRGDLGWFPRGYLVQPKVEDAAFSLQPGGVSDVIQTDAGYHIIQVIERDAQHPLTPDAYSTLQHAALQQWIQDRLLASQIETYIQ